MKSIDIKIVGMSGDFRLYRIQNRLSNFDDVDRQESKRRYIWKQSKLGLMAFTVLVV